MYKEVPVNNVDYYINIKSIKFNLKRKLIP